jgi:hypothetical protein
MSYYPLPPTLTKTKAGLLLTFDEPIEEDLHPGESVQVTLEYKDGYWIVVGMNTTRISGSDRTNQ